MIGTMEGSELLVATRVGVALLAGMLAVLLLLRAVRAPRGERALVPTIALVVILVATGSSLIAFRLEVSQLWFAAFPVLVATFPDGRFVPRWIVWPVVAFELVYVVDLVSAHALSSQAWWWLVPSSQVAIVAAQVYRYLRRSTTAERESVRWAILGVVLSVAAFLALAIGSPAPIGEGGPLLEGLANLAIVPILVGPAIGLLRPRLWNVDAAFRVVLAALVSGSVLAGAYWAATAVATRLGAPDATAGWWGALVVGVLAYPTIRLALRLATFVVYRGRADAATATARLGERLADRPEPAQVAETVVRTVVDALFLDAAELRGGGIFDASIGAPIEHHAESAGIERFPIVFHGEELAELVVPPRRGESSLTASDREVVERIAVHAAPALHGARALAELSDAHARLVLAREEERRRLRRDLHDDLSPTLSGLSLAAAAVAKRAVTAAPELAEQAAELHRDIQAAVEQSREIAYGLRPPILDDRGLVAAIRDRVHGQGADALRVEVRAPEAELVLPAAVDLAALRIVQEAVSNVRRHAKASTCTITLERRGGELRVQVDDDGVGIPSRVRGGLGLASMRERATELGGSARFGTAPGGGGRVTVRLPAHDGVVA